MNVNEDELVGEPLDQVPQQDSTDESCMGRRSEKRDGKSVFLGYCGAWSGKGTDHVGEGRCSKHGGAGGAPEGNDNAVGNDGGAEEGNTNAVTHGAYADHNSYYQNVLDDAMREFVDDVFEDYLERYCELHGDPPLGIESELFRISVTHAKDIDSACPEKTWWLTGKGTTQRKCQRLSPHPPRGVPLGEVPRPRQFGNWHHIRMQSISEGEVCLGTNRL